MPEVGPALTLGAPSLSLNLLGERHRAKPERGPMLWRVARQPLSPPPSFHWRVLTSAATSAAQRRIGGLRHTCQGHLQIYLFKLDRDPPSSCHGCGAHGVPGPPGSSPLCVLCHSPGRQVLSVPPLQMKMPRPGGILCPA